MTSIPPMNPNVQQHIQNAQTQAATTTNNASKDYSSNKQQVKTLLRDYHGASAADKTAIATQLGTSLHAADDARQKVGGRKDADFAKLWGQVNGTGDLHSVLDSGDTATQHGTAGTGTAGLLKTADTAIGNAYQGAASQNKYQALRTIGGQLVTAYSDKNASPDDKSKIKDKLGQVLTGMRDTNNGLNHANDTDQAKFWGQVNASPDLKAALDPNT